MNNSITVGGLLFTLCGLAGLALCGFGALATFAAGMSTNPEASADANRTGCKTFITGGVLLAISIWGLFL